MDKDLIRRTYDAFMLARKGKADQARTALAALAIEAGPQWESVKLAAMSYDARRNA